MARILAAVFALLVLAAAAGAATVRLSHPYGELIDRDPVTAHFEASNPDRIDCTIAPAVAREGNVVTVTVRRVAPGTMGPICTVPNQVSIGELSVGAWKVVLKIIDAFGTTLIEQHESEWRVRPPDTLCGQHPLLRGSVFVDHMTLRTCSSQTGSHAILRSPLAFSTRRRCRAPSRSPCCSTARSTTRTMSGGAASHRRVPFGAAERRRVLRDLAARCVRRRDRVLQRFARSLFLCR